MAPLKKVWDEGKLAILHGVGYTNSPRSHFRSMDIWHTCEPDKVGTEGWLGRVAREYDPNKENVVTVVSFGPSLFRARWWCPAFRWRAWPAPWRSMGSCRSVQERELRLKVLDRFANMYAPVAGSGVMEYLGTTGLDSLKGADVLKVAPQQVRVDGASIRIPRSPGSSAGSPRCISRIWAAGSSTAITAASTPMPARTPATAPCGAR